MFNPGEFVHGTVSIPNVTIKSTDPGDFRTVTLPNASAAIEYFKVNRLSGQLVSPLGWVLFEDGIVTGTNGEFRGVK